VFVVGSLFWAIWYQPPEEVNNYSGWMARCNMAIQLGNNAQAAAPP
jgi:hypothetical protein